MSHSDTLRGWDEKERVTYFLDNADIIVPKRQEQLTFLVDLFGWSQEEPIAILDLGAGFGALTEKILTRYPCATVTCVDGSTEMMTLARERLAPYGQRVRLHGADLAFPSWQDSLHGPFHAVVSALAIHHLPDERKQQLYHEVCQLLSPGGLFLNNDVVTSPPLLQERFETLWYRDIQAREQRSRGVKRSLAAIRAEMQERLRMADHQSHLTPLRVQLDWLRTAGFQSVDCVWKYLDLAIFGGVKAGESDEERDRRVERPSAQAALRSERSRSSFSSHSNTDSPVANSNQMTSPTAEIPAAREKTSSHLSVNSEWGTLVLSY